MHGLLGLGGFWSHHVKALPHCNQVVALAMGNAMLNAQQCT